MSRTFEFPGSTKRVAIQDSARRAKVKKVVGCADLRPDSRSAPIPLNPSLSSESFSLSRLLRIRQSGGGLWGFLLCVPRNLWFCRVLLSSLISSRTLPVVCRHVHQRIQPRSRRSKVRSSFLMTFLMSFISFIKQYYEMFAKNPAELHRFYKDESSFSHAEGHQVELFLILISSQFLFLGCDKRDFNREYSGMHWRLATCRVSFGLV
jgi:hypothetical protein